jgi:hypothetical protein
LGRRLGQSQIGDALHKKGIGTRYKTQKRNLEIMPRTLNLSLSRPRQRFWFQLLCIVLYNCALNCAFHCLCIERSSSIKAASSMPSSTILQPNLPPQHNFKSKYATKSLSPYSALKPSQVNNPISYATEGGFPQIARKAGHKEKTQA